MSRKRAQTAPAVNNLIAPLERPRTLVTFGPRVAGEN